MPPPRRSALQSKPRNLVFTSAFARPDSPVFAPIWCAEHFFSGPWPCACPPGPQVLAIGSTADEITYGGGRGGGKTEIMFAFLSKGNNTKGFSSRGVPIYRSDIKNSDVSYLMNPNYRALLLIEQASEMGYILERAERFWRVLQPTITKSSPAEIVFPSKALIRCCHFGEDGWKKTLGPEYVKIAIDQLEKMALRETYDKIKGSNRTKYPEMKPQVFSTWNPGGGDDLTGAPGQGWIMDHFQVDAYLDGRCEPWRYMRQENGDTTHFINAKVMDNPFFRWKMDRVDGVYRQVHQWQCDPEQGGCGYKYEAADPSEKCERCGKTDTVETGPAGAMA